MAKMRKNITRSGSKVMLVSATNITRISQYNKTLIHQYNRHNNRTRVATYVLDLVACNPNDRFRRELFFEDINIL